MAANKELIKSSKAVELQSTSAKKQPANNLPFEVYRTIDTCTVRLRQGMKIMAQKDLHRGSRMNRMLELKAEHAKQQQA
jgi:hypothetical protein